MRNNFIEKFEKQRDYETKPGRTIRISISYGLLCKTRVKNKVNRAHSSPATSLRRRDSRDNEFTRMVGVISSSGPLSSNCCCVVSLDPVTQYGHNVKPFFV
ncbi:uncharacterized protein LOC114253194 [Bombyx mandarina]|uniref:Uncharacterized protein LOC114253194 n=1 Tax=Bombyx mandarina TaxID=7092 RepID=A0A6J2KS21_BOMMA|nr:uncharacterized protein LOC114253194 [Bombyx mandarina]